MSLQLTSQPLAMARNTNIDDVTVRNIYVEREILQIITDPNQSIIMNITPSADLSFLIVRIQLPLEVDHVDTEADIEIHLPDDFPVSLDFDLVRSIDSLIFFFQSFTLQSPFDF